MLRRVALNALSRRDHSVAELKQKLLKKSDDVECIQQVLQSLIDKGFLNDTRFSELLIHSKYRQGLGPRRIALLLKEKGLSSHSVNTAFKDEEWYEGLAMTWAKRFSEKPKDNKSYGQQARYLQYRGFSLEHINRFLREPYHEQQ